MYNPVINSIDAVFRWGAGYNESRGFQLVFRSMSRPNIDIVSFSLRK